MKSAITVSLVAEARGGPFVFWDGLADACQRAGDLGFDAIEVFAPEPAAISASELRPLLNQAEIQLAAMGTGGGWVKHRLTLTASDASVRQKGIEFICGVIDKAAEFGASAIVGSMQGRWGDGIDKKTALSYLQDALSICGRRADQHHLPLLFEPLNRYETNLCNTIAEGLALVNPIENVLLLADLFHMNIEEDQIPAAIRQGGKKIGHVHFVDSNRRPAGYGHLDFASIFQALREIQFQGFLSAEAFAYPDSETAARATIETYRKHFH